MQQEQWTSGATFILTDGRKVRTLPDADMEWVLSADQRDALDLRFCGWGYDGRHMTNEIIMECLSKRADDWAREYVAQQCAVPVEFV